MKKDINFIKFIKPQLVKKEKRDKMEHREKEFDNAMRIAGLNSPGIDITDLGLVMGTLKAMERKQDTPEEK